VRKTRQSFLASGVEQIVISQLQPRMAALHRAFNFTHDGSELENLNRSVGTNQRQCDG